MRPRGERSPSSAGRGSTSWWVRATGAFLLGALLFATYLWIVGPAPVQQALGRVSPRRLVSLLVVGVLPVVVWGSALHLVFVRFGIARQLGTSVLLFAAASFLNSVTPFGQVGGDPLSAVLFKRSLRTDFETGLAAIGSVNALNRLGSLFLGLLGAGYLGTQVTFGRTLELGAMVSVAATVVVLVGAAIVWYRRQTFVHASATVLASVLEPVGRLPGLTPPSRDNLVRRGHRFFAAIGRLVDAPWTLGFVFIAGIAGQLAVASTLWIALAALGTDAPVALVVLLIPVAKLGGAAPTPGGSGSAEALLTALLAATMGIDIAIAGAAAILYRASAFWVPSLVGGMATAWYVIHEPEPESKPQSEPLSEPQSEPEAEPQSEPGAEPPPEPDGRELARFLRRSASPSALASEMGGDTGLGVTIVLLAASVALVVLLVAVVHSRQLLVEPDSLLVHTTRDTALAVLSFGLTWVTLRRLTAVWLE